MNEKDQKKRKAPISYRPPASLQEEFEMRVERSGKSVNGFITSAIFSGDVPRSPRTPPRYRPARARTPLETACETSPRPRPSRASSSVVERAPPRPLARPISFAPSRAMSTRSRDAAETTRTHARLTTDATHRRGTSPRARGVGCRARDDGRRRGSEPKGLRLESRPVTLSHDR